MMDYTTTVDANNSF